jgi:F-type H+-transporting ATPase subunit delta
VREISLHKLYDICGQRAAGLEQELYDFLSLLDSNFELKVFLEEVGVAAESKKKLLQELLPGRSDLLLSFISLLIDQELMKKIRSLLAEFTAIISARTGTRLVKISSASQLTPEEKELIGGKLKAARIRFETDPALIGGLRIKWEGGVLINASYSGYLNELKEKISA